MNQKQDVLDSLARMGISYTLHEHTQVFTMEECARIEGINWQTTEMCKNVFLCNRQQTQYYLMLIRHDVAFRTAVVSKALSVSRLSFADESQLPLLLGLSAGAVSPMGLLFDTGQRVRLVADEGLRQYEMLAFHPCVNTATIVLHASDFWNIFTRAISHEATFVKCTGD